MRQVSTFFTGSLVFVIATYLFALALQQQDWPGTVSDYHGFVRHDFEVAGVAAIVVEPHKTAEWSPWIWRTEFFDHRPMVDLALLERGYHLVHIAVGNTFGSPAAMHRFDQFYSLLQSHGLNKKVVLEGFSRGGLYAYNWAAMNPDKVQAIYGDAPVTDFRTWPYGGSGAKRSDADWSKLVSDFGFPNEAAALEYPFNPIDKLAVLATAKIPIIHVVGDADSVVPVEANTNELERRYVALGGTMSVVHKEGGDHHPHSLDDPSPVVDFILAHAGDTADCPPATVIPAPNTESRYMSAGWRGRSWMDQHEDGLKGVASNRPQAVLLGDSISQGWAGPGRQVGGAGGAARKRHLDQFNVVSLGISGDRTQHVLWRLDNGMFDKHKPRVVSLLIGVNNLNGDSPSAIAQGIEKILEKIQEKAPDAVIVLNALFPIGKEPSDPRREKVVLINKHVSTFADGQRVLWLDISSLLLLEDGTADPTKMASDSLHLAVGGYEVWAVELERVFERVLIG